MPGICNRQCTEHQNTPQICINHHFRGTRFITESPRCAPGLRWCTDWGFRARTFIIQAFTHVHEPRLCISWGAHARTHSTHPSTHGYVIHNYYTYTCADSFVKYVQAWKHHFVHERTPCACTDNCLMYVHSRKLNNWRPYPCVEGCVLCVRAYGIPARYRVVLVEHLGGLFFDGGRSCAGDSFAGHSGMYCCESLVVSTLFCVWDSVGGL